MANLLIKLSMLQRAKGLAPRRKFIGAAPGKTCTLVKNRWLI